MQGKTLLTHFRRRRVKRTRRRILGASLRVFSRLGYDGASMDDIALELEATKGLVYHYFRSKQELLKAVLEEHALLADIESLRRGIQAESSLHEALSAVALQSLRTMGKHRAFIRFLLMQAQSSQEQAELVFREVLDRWIAAFQSIIQAHLSETSRPTAQLLARQVVDIILASFIRNELGSQASDDLESYVQDALETIISRAKAEDSRGRKVQ